MPPRGGGTRGAKQDREDIAQAWLQRDGVNEELRREFESGVGARLGELFRRFRQRRARERATEFMEAEKSALLAASRKRKASSALSAVAPASVVTKRARGSNAERHEAAAAEASPAWLAPPVLPASVLGIGSAPQEADA